MVCSESRWLDTRVNFLAGSVAKCRAGFPGRVWGVASPGSVWAWHPRPQRFE